MSTTLGIEEKANQLIYGDRRNSKGLRFFLLNFIHFLTVSIIAIGEKEGYRDREETKRPRTNEKGVVGPENASGGKGSRIVKVNLFHRSGTGNSTVKWNNGKN
jgi:hypothetical protein